jgi:hypothetical protein
MMVEIQWDGRNTGLIPVLSSMSEKLNEEDRAWRDAHFALPAFTNIAGQTLTRADINQHQRAWTGRVWALMKWSKKYWFRVDGQSYNKASYGRRARYERRMDRLPHTRCLESLDQSWFRFNTPSQAFPRPIIPQKVLNDRKLLLLVYGVNVIVVKLNRRTRTQYRFIGITPMKKKRATRLAFLFILGAATFLSSSMLYTNAVRWVFVGLSCFLAVLAAIIYWGTLKYAAQMTPNQLNLFNRISRGARQIEMICRVLKNEIPPLRTDDEDARCIDVLLYSSGEKTWCRCQPTPSGPESQPEIRNTWIRVIMQSSSPNIDRPLKALSVLIHSIFPWGWVEYKPNLLFSVIFLILECSFSGLGALDLLIAVFLKTLVKKTFADSLGRGDNWNISWYLMLSQVLSGFTMAEKLWNALTTKLPASPVELPKTGP